MTAGTVTGHPGFRERYFTSGDGLRLYFRDYGDPASTQPAALCLTGLTRNSKDFHDLALRLSAGRRVLCPDYRGRGRSQYAGDWRRYHVRAYLDDMRHLLSVAGAHRVVVIGTSLGGLLAMAMAVAMPSAVAGAVINDIGPDVDGDGLGRIVAAYSDPQPLSGWPEAVRHLKETMPNLPADDDEDWMRIARNSFRVGEDGLLHYDWDPALIESIRRSGDHGVDLWRLFGALSRVPVLAVRGALSDVLSQSTFTRMTEVMPDLVTVTVDGVGHAPKLTESHVLEAIDAHFAKLRDPHHR